MANLVGRINLLVGWQSVIYNLQNVQHYSKEDVLLNSCMILIDSTIMLVKETWVTQKARPANIVTEQIKIIYLQSKHIITQKNKIYIYKRKR